MIKHVSLTRDAALAGLVECAGLVACATDPSEHVALAHDPCQSVLEALARVTVADRASLMVLDEDRDALVIVASLGLPEAVAEQTRVSLGEAICGWVAEHGESLLLAPGQEIPGPVRAAMRQPSITSSLSVPISWDGAVLGVLNLGRLGRAAPFDQAHLQFAALVAEQLGHFESLSRLRRETSERGVFVSQFIESIPSSMLVVDRGLRVVSANRHFLESVRRQPEATVGHRLVDVLPPWLTKYAPMEEKLRTVFRTGAVLDGGDVLQRSTGNVYFFRFVPITVGGAVQQVMLLVDDVTDQHQLGAEARMAERHLAGVVQSANDIVASLDREGRIVTWNPAAERVSGWSFDEVRGKLLSEIGAPEDQAVLAQILTEPLSAPRTQDQEARLVAPDGRESIVAWSSSPMFDDEGAVMGMVVVGRDLTAYRMLTNQLIQSEKMASLGVMAGGIAHELRTPLAVTGISAQLLLENPDDLELRGACLQKIDASTKRAALIIDNLLTFARPQAERLGKIEIDALLDETLALMADQMVLQMVRVSRERQPARFTMTGNRDLLQQVFTNLMLNACNAMPEGGELRIAATAEEDDLVKIVFQDTGEGIAAENLDHLFDPFFTTRPPGSKSAGLGLSISYSIVEQHAGTIEVQSQVGKGSTFTVSLPARRGG